MQRKFILLWLLFFIVVGCSSHHPADTITQASTIDLLLAGQYDGQMTCGQLWDTVTSASGHSTAWMVK